MEPWQTVLVALGGNAMLLAVLGWLSKSLVQGLLAKDVERFRATLATESSATVEKVKHELQLVAVEHQVRYSKLHEKRADVIAELYRLLVEAFWAGSGFVSPLELAGEPKIQEKYVTAMNSSADFFRFFEIHKIYLPAPLCEKLETFVRGMRNKAIGFGVWIQQGDAHLLPNTVEQKHKAWIDAWEYFEKEVPPARAALEAELRALLGAKEPQK